MRQKALFLCKERKKKKSKITTEYEKMDQCNLIDISNHSFQVKNLLVPNKDLYNKEEWRNSLLTKQGNFMPDLPIFWIVRASYDIILSTTRSREDFPIFIFDKKNDSIYWCWKKINAASSLKKKNSKCHFQTQCYYWRLSKTLLFQGEQNRHVPFVR